MTRKHLPEITHSRYVYDSDSDMPETLESDIQKYLTYKDEVAEFRHSDKEDASTEDDWI